MNYCPNCGAPTVFRIPDDDNRPRNICTASGEIFYENPRNVVGTIIERDDKILLCRRAIEPRKHFWTLPAGFMELGETCAEGAARETHEEAGVTIAEPQLFTLIDITHIGQIHMFFRARMVGETMEPGPESSAVQFVDIEAIDWQQLAFPSIHRTLERYLHDRAQSAFQLHVEALEQHDWAAMQLDSQPRNLS